MFSGNYANRVTCLRILTLIIDSATEPCVNYQLAGAPDLISNHLVNANALKGGTQ